MLKKDNITLVIDNNVVEKYEKYYYQCHPRAKKKPIEYPHHPSINAWMVMMRPMMNDLKQRWKDFIVWYIESMGYQNLKIAKCDIRQKIYYAIRTRHDVDNTVPKFILDGLTESGFIVDDDCKHVQRLILECGVDMERPRTELMFTNIVYEEDLKK